MTGLFLAAPSPSPTDVTIDGTPVGSPGFLGFVFTFVLAVAVVFLFLSLTKQLRVVDRRAKTLGLDDDADDRTAGPHADLGMIDAGPGGPDTEVDADVEVVSRDVVPGQRDRQRGRLRGAEERVPHRQREIPHVRG